MTRRDREVCEHCGHQFRTGLGAPPLDAPITDEATLHRTMQFTLPPLPPREETVAPETPGSSWEMAGGPRRRGAAPFALAAIGMGLALLGALIYFHHAGAARAAPPSPAGIWETTGAGRAPQDARLQFVFRGDGGGSFSWAAGGVSPRSGQAPLRWQLAPDGRLVLSIPPPDATAAPVSGQMITLLGSHPWLWRVDRTQHRLVIGPLSLTEK